MVLLLVVVAMQAERTSAAFPGRDGLLVTMAYDFDSEPSSQNIITIDPKSGATQIVVSSTEDYLSDTHWSPDGELIAFYRIQIEGGSGFPVTSTIRPDGTDEQVVGKGVPLGFSPDGKKLLLQTKGDLQTINVNGSGRKTVLEKNDLLKKGEGAIGGASWSPDGKRIVYAASADDIKKRQKRSLFLVRPNGKGLEALPSLSGARQPDWSPDGKTIYYERNTKVPVKVLSLRVGAKRPVKLVKGNQPAASPSGRSLAYNLNGEKFFILPLKGGGKAKELKPKTDLSVESFDSFDWQPLP